MRKRKGIQKKKGKKETIKKAKSTEDDQLVTNNSGFPFFANMFTDFLIELVVSLDNPTNLMSTCHSMHDLRLNNSIAFRNLKCFAKYSTRDAPGFLTSQYFTGTIYGYLIQNYNSFISRHESKLLKDPNYRTEGDDNDGLQDSKSKDFEKMLQDIHIYSKFNNQMFTVEACRRMRIFSRCPITQTYARLLSYNIFVTFPIITDIYSSLDLFKPRELNSYEHALFNEVVKPSSRPPIEQPINTYDRFRNNMATHFRADVWEQFINWDDFVCVGGAVVKAILVDSFESTSTQDIDMFWVRRCERGTVWSRPGESSYYGYEKAVKKFKTDLGSLIGEENVKLLKQYQYVRTVTATFPAGGDKPARVIPFQFIWYCEVMNPASVIQIFDLECCQVGYANGKVFCSYAFAQSIATRTSINYKLVNDADDISDFMPRTQKYQARGFTLLVPKNFDSSLLDKEYESTHKILARTADEKYGFLLNNDSLLVRSQFVALIDPTAPQPHETKHRPAPSHLKKKNRPKGDRSDSDSDSDSDDSDRDRDRDEEDDDEGRDTDGDDPDLINSDGEHKHDITDFRYIVGSGPYFEPISHWPKST